MGKEREAYFPTTAEITERFIPERIEKRRKQEERKKKLAKDLARLQRPLIRPVTKKTKGKGARVSVQRGIRGLLDLA